MARSVPQPQVQPGEDIADVPLMFMPQGLDRLTAPFLLKEGFSPDTTDADHYLNQLGILGPRKGRRRVAAFPEVITGLLPYVLPTERGRIVGQGGTTPSWGAVVPPNTTASGAQILGGVLAGNVNYITPDPVRGCQYKGRFYAFNGRNRMRAYAGPLGWSNAGIDPPVTLPVATIAVGGFTTFDQPVLTSYSVASNVVTLNFTVPHGLVFGQAITVLSGVSGLNVAGVPILSVPTPTSITYAATLGDVGPPPVSFVGPTTAILTLVGFALSTAARVQQTVPGVVGFTDDNGTEIPVSAIAAASNQTALGAAYQNGGLQAVAAANFQGYHPVMGTAGAVKQSGFPIMAVQWVATSLTTTDVTLTLDLGGGSNPFVIGNVFNIPTLISPPLPLSGTHDIAPGPRVLVAVGPSTVTFTESVASTDAYAADGTSFGLGTGYSTKPLQYRYKVVVANLNKSTPEGLPIQSNYVEATYPGGATSINVNDGDAVALALPTPPSDAQITHWRIFRTASYGAVFYWLADAPGTGGTSYVDCTPDDSLPREEPLRDQNAIPATFKQGCVFADRLFGCGFAPITTGSVSGFGSTTVVAEGVSWPDGIAGCWFQCAAFPGKEFRIRSVATNGASLVLEDAPGGAGFTSTTYSIYRYPWEVYFSVFGDPEANGPAGEANRYLRELPGHERAVALVPFGDQLLVFASSGSGDVIYEIHVNPGGTQPTDVLIGAFPLSNGYGMVNCDCFHVSENELHFLSHFGPAMLKLEGTLRLLGFPRYLSPPVRIGDKLRTEWLDRLADTQQQLCRVGGDVFNVYYDVPIAGGAENLVRYRFSRRFGTWWEERYANASCYCNDFDSAGVPGCCFFGQGKVLGQAGYGTTDFSATVLTGTVSANTATSLSTTGAAFQGTEEAYVFVFDNLGSLAFYRRITSIDSFPFKTLNWPGSGAGGGAIAGSYVGCTYVIGAIWMRWMTRAVYAPGKQSRILDAVVCNDTYNAGSGLAYSRSDYSFGTLTTGSRRDLAQSEPFQVGTVNQRGPEYQMLLESRAGAVFRAVTARVVTETTDK